MTQTSSRITISDFFVGCGGSTEGAEQTGAEVIMGMNHWKRALETYGKNHPKSKPILTDLTNTNPRKYPSTTMALFSPECTNHSLAKGHARKFVGYNDLWGGQNYDPAEERSRQTMWTPLEWAEVHEYPICITENVVDARMWKLFKPWLAAWKALDYEIEIVYLNSMFAHPTPQSRDRMYVVAWKKGIRKPNLAITPSAWCAHCQKNVASVQCWKNPSKPWGKYKQQYDYRCPGCNTLVLPYYYAAATAIDWSKKTQRIGDRKKPLQAKTMRRIEIGLKKYEKSHPFLLQTNKTDDRTLDALNEVLPTQTCSHGLGVVHPPFLLNLFHAGESPSYVYQPSEDSFPTQTTRQEMALVEPFTFSLNHEALQSAAVLREALTTQTTFDDQGLCVPQPFIIDHLDTQKGYRDRSIYRHFSTFCASGNHQSVVIPPYLLDLHGTSTTHEITDPLGAFSAGGGHHALIEPPMPAWLMTYYNTGQMYEVHEEAMPTATTLARHALVTTDELPCAIEDCGFRMLDPDEIRAGMAFPNSYEVTGTRREQVKQLGNAVTPPAMKLLVQRCIESLS